MGKLLEVTQTFNETEFWNDSCSYDELKEAIKNGASGATTNPVIVLNVLKKELPKWDETIKEIVAENPTATEDEIAWMVIKLLGENAGSLLYPQFKESNGQRGRISFQTNAKFYKNKEKMVAHALELSKVIENSQIKIPASKAGIEAFEELTYLGVSINATVSFTCPQAIAVAEAVERGLNRRVKEGLPIDNMHPVCTIMVGRLDDYLKAYVQDNNIDINPEFLDLAGVLTCKNAYKLYKKRGYRTKLLVAAFRNNYHFTEFIGGDIVLTITTKYQNIFNELDIEVANYIDKDLSPDILEELLRLEEFRKAYYEDGLKPEEFEHYGAFLRTMNQFLNGYDDLVKIIRSYIVK
ncbi:transaldolase family protein [Clostridium perfringens]|uniref:Transaldolase n=1 Tax=Clostridium perfringens TaxID=1502 RepID=A0A8H9R0K2_CLOPF|nr:transaldolase family protein [Clostridium perfringens]MDK0537478.1 transaldolase family protein [Clostridium perfringens]TPE21215.1 transaldolase [Clostridium perfringens]HAT4308243.1 transaldolase [Clostridium perfringens]HAT4312804.1 transaldolase [Clostridium perfringens]